MAKDKFVALQLLEQVQHELDSDLSQALELLSEKLLYGFNAPKVRQAAVSREYAELREARSLLRHLKHPDHAENALVRFDELAWALKLARKTCQDDGQTMCLGLFDRAAEILGIELTAHHALPVDLNRKIRNELQMMGVEEVAVVTEIPVVERAAESALIAA